MLPKSIRWRIQAWHGFLLVCLVGALLVAFYSYERAETFRQTDAELQAALAPLLPALGGRPPVGRPRRFEDVRRTPPGPEFEGGENFDHPQRPGGPEEMDRLPEPVRTGRYYYVSWFRDGTIRLQSSNAPPRVPFPSESDFASRKALRSHGEFREALHYGPDGGCTAVGTSLRPAVRQLHRLAWMLVAFGFVIVGAGMLVGWWVAGRALRPLTEISATAEKITTGHLSQRINVSDTESELGQLAIVLNQTFERLEKNLEQQVRFTADASHELRTPVSVILTQTQLALSRERSSEEYRKTLETCERAAERMRALINQLLDLARMDVGDQTLLLESCDLGRVAREALEFIEPLAQKKSVKLNHSLQPVRIKGDLMKLGQVMINLLNNAIVHNKEGVEVCLSVEEKNGKAVIRISDNGIGIPQEALPQLFDRFYRVDKARARGQGSSGLGLAICKSIVEAHRGMIEAESRPGQGTVFTIELPLNFATQTRINTA